MLSSRDWILLPKMASIHSIPEETANFQSKRIKISIFQPNHFGANQQFQELLLHKDDFPGLNPGDVIEIYHPDNEGGEDGEMHAPRVLLMVSKSHIYPLNGLQKPINRETLNIEKSLAETFLLPNYKDVIVTKVSKHDVGLDSVELTFKEQYMGRSEMWRLAKSLRDTVVYQHKKVELCQGQIRCNVNEMWAQGIRISSGYITPDTKVVFRSPTAMVYLFIQMSSEMWKFDVHGEVFYEKAVDGFLAEMFHRWEKKGSSHEVTIVLFSRCFYQADSIDDFPERMRDCLQMGFNNCFYEDFYRVVVQNERFDDWSPTLRELKRIFTNYKDYILDYHKMDEGETIPKPFISSASQGNFLEVLNVSLNTFEHHYLNRNLDRTGQQSIVITPGVGIFEVDRELTMITKQRIIDSGVGSDLICIGEQPLHAVPLFKFCHKGATNAPPDDYSMPHWINLSFYSKGSKRAYGNFKTRIRVPRLPEPSRRVKVEPLEQSLLKNGVANPVGDILDVGEAYDESIFEKAKSLQEKNVKRKMSDPEIMLASGISKASEAANKGASYLDKFQSENLTPKSEALFSSSWDDRSMTTEKLFRAAKNGGLGDVTLDPNFIGSIDTTFDHQAIKKYLLRPGRALINPFDPSHTTVRMSSNRRRWTHIFPKGPTGQHAHAHHTFDKLDVSSVLAQISRIGDGNGRGDIQQPSNEDLIWSAAQQTGVDWKSLTIPASLPITTDYFPEPQTLENDYVFNEYELNPEEIISDSASDRSPLFARSSFPSNEEIFTELVSQRLAQGFQLILLTPTQLEAISAPSAPASAPAPSVPTPSRSFASKLKLRRSSVNSTPGKSVVFSQPAQAPAAEYWLSIGRIFHKVSLSADKKTIKVHRYRPRHPYEALNIHYRYRFGAPDNNNYELSWVDFSTQKLENFNWNHMDFYVCTRASDKEFLLTENLKYWRFRLMAIPLHPYVKFTKQIMESLDARQNRGVYSVTIDQEARSDLTRGFIRFLEICLNRIKKPVSNISKVRQGMASGSFMQPSRSASGLREHRANTIGVDRSQIELNRRRQPSGGAQVLSPSNLSAQLSPDIKGSTHMMDQMQVGSLETQVSAPGGLQMCPDGQADPGQDQLKSTSTLIEISDEMKKRLNFVNKGLPGMPPMTFLAFEAVSWVMASIEGISSEAHAVKLLKSMHEKRYICHASGDPKQPFVNGFYLFSLTPNPKTGVDAKYGGHIEAFQNDWVEVEFASHMGTDHIDDSLNGGKEFLKEDMPIFVARQKFCERLAQKPFYKSVTLDVDQANRSDRQEWGHLKYQHFYDPAEAFELAIQWSVATGAIISDLLHLWARKAQGYGISLIPVPSDPFALPITKNSDPVRGPIFIQLDTEFLRDEEQQQQSNGSLFQEFPQASKEQRLFLFREAIAHRFGFVNSTTDRSQQPSSAMFSTDHQYIHCTGNMFLLIPTQFQSQTGIQGFKGRLNADQGPYHKPSEVHDNIFTRHLSDTKPAYDHSETGFLWSWNFMISRKWKTTSNTGATGDIAFMDEMLADFRAFCRNDQQRLSKFWRECQAKQA